MFFKLSESVILTKNKKEKLIVVCNLKSSIEFLKSKNSVESLKLTNIQGE